MTRTVIRSTITMILAAGLLAVPATATAARPAAESATVSGFQPEGLFRLAVKPAGGPKTVVKLSCSPDRGSHPDPEAACADMAGADGRVGRIPEDSAACTKQFAPVTVTASGVWHGKPRFYKERFGNGCQAVGQTGGDVFDF